MPGHRILLVGTTRPGVDEKWLAELDAAAADDAPRRSPGSGPKDLVRLLADAFHSERLAAELAGRIALKSDGNPFFVFEILRGLREGQFLDAEARRHVGDDAGHPRHPDPVVDRSTS